MTPKRWIALLSVLGILIAAALTTAAVMNRSDGRSSEDSPLLVAPTTTKPIVRSTTTHTATTVDLAKLPHPDAPPADPYAATPIVQIGSIQIPKIGLLHAVFEGITLTVIDHGPGHWPGSALPCQAGNAVFPGHRVTHSHPFLNLDLLSPGDQIVFHMPGHDCVYKVTGTQIVQPSALYVTNPSPTPTVTLIACHPKHSAAQRIVVTGELIADIPVKA
ncbi:MAG TPA: class E sortase [Acidimicrobiia bacterium]|nr:class E sortase [Acidimicrobiia bacterium]